MRNDIRNEVTLYYNEFIDFVAHNINANGERIKSTKEYAELVNDLIFMISMKGDRQKYEKEIKAIREFEEEKL